MSKIKVLVTPAGTEIGHEIAESLKFSKHFDLIGANSVEDHSEFVFPRVIVGSPFANQDGYVPYINKIVRDEQINVVMPAHDDAIYQLSGHVEGALLAAPVRPLADILRFKSRILEALSGVVPVPEVYNQANIKYPAFMKPDRGQGSRGTKLLGSIADLYGLNLNMKEFVFQEVLPGREVTVDCFSSPQSDLLFVGPRLRERISGGIATRMRSLFSRELEAFATEISRTLRLVGAWFFQAKEDVSKQFKVLEVANRIAGSSGHQRMRGVNLVEAWLHQLCGREIEFAPIPSINFVSDRALYYRTRSEVIRNVYVDFDDTAFSLAENTVNARLIGTLLGLKVNKGVSIHLLTRHAGEIEQVLKRIGLDKLFDHIYHLRNGERKSDYIVEREAVFIDDSFRERLEVAKRRGILCLPPESIEYLEGCLLR